MEGLPSVIPKWIEVVLNSRARKLYTSARIYEWKFGKGEWKLPFASPTVRVEFFSFVIIFEECFTACKSNANTVNKDRSVGLKCH